LYNYEKNKHECSLQMNVPWIYRESVHRPGSGPQYYKWEQRFEAHSQTES